MSKRVIPLTPDRGATWLSIALEFFILRLEVDATVGGGIQCAIVDGGGFRTIQFTVSGPNDATEWEEISPKPGELKTWNSIKSLANRPSATTLHQVFG
jgi:hypothetical protein